MRSALFCLFMSLRCAHYIGAIREQNPIVTNCMYKNGYMYVHCTYILITRIPYAGGWEGPGTLAPLLCATVKGVCRCTLLLQIFCAESLQNWAGPQAVSCASISGYIHPYPPGVFSKGIRYFVNHSKF